MSGELKTVRFIIGSLDIGGTESHLAQILPELSKETIIPIVITITHKGALAEKLEAKGIEVIAPGPITRCLQRIPLLSRLLGPIATIPYLARSYKKNPAVLTCFYLPSSYYLGMMAILLTGETGNTVMFRRSLNIYQKKRPFVSRIERWLHKKQRVIVGNSQAVIDQLAEEEKVPKQNLLLIYNGIDISKYGDHSNRQMIRKKLGISNGAVVLSVVANLIPYKGHRDLIDALAMIKGEIQCPWVLLCIGTGIEHRRDLLKLVNHYHLQNNIKWLGQRDDVPLILSASDIGISASHQEGFSNAILEGMASGLPMVVTNVGGNREAVVHEKSGLLVKPHHPEELGKAILLLINDMDLARRYGMAAKERVRSYFSIERCVNNYISFFKSTLKDNDNYPKTLSD